MGDYNFDVSSTHPFKISEIVKDLTYSEFDLSLKFCNYRKKNLSNGEDYSQSD